MESAMISQLSVEEKQEQNFKKPPNPSPTKVYGWPLLQATENPIPSLHIPTQGFLFLCSFLRFELPSELCMVDFREGANSSCYIIFFFPPETRV